MLLGLVGLGLMFPAGLAVRSARGADAGHDNLSGRAGRARFDALDRGEQIRFYLALWLLFVVGMGVTLALGRGSDLLWIAALIRISAPVFSGIAWHAIRTSEERKAQQSDG